MNVYLCCRRPASARFTRSRPRYHGKKLLLYLVHLGNFGLEYALRIVVRLSSVHRNRFSQSHGMPELSRKYLSLNVPRRIVVVVIKTDLAPSYVSGMCHGFNTVVVISTRVLNKIHISRRGARMEERNAYMSFSISLV